jgi:hypothetical protein
VIASSDIAQDMMLTPLEVERLREARKRLQQFVARTGSANATVRPRG